MTQVAEALINNNKKKLLIDYAWEQIDHPPL